MLARTSVAQEHRTINTIPEDDEDKAKRSDTTGRKQLARYAVEMLSARGDRKYALGVRLNAHQMTFSFYHRSGIIEADHFDVCKNPEFFAMFLLMFQKEPRFYGFNTTMGYCDPFDIHNPDTMKMDEKVVREQLKLTELELGELVSSEYCVVGRGSAVIKAKSSGADCELVVKFSWQEESRRHEAEYIRDASTVIGKNVAKVFGYAELDDDTPMDSLFQACTEKGTYKTKKYRMIVMKYYKGIATIDSLDKLWNLLLQLVKCEW